MTTAWSHLPNAKHINWVLASLEEHPKKWNAARDAIWDAAMDAAMGAAMDAAWSATWDAILALIAYDDCAYLIETDVDELRILAALGDTRAVLLLPACIVFNEIKDL